MTIQSVSITNLYGNDYKWQLNPDVNILVGANGTYKSKILRLIKCKLQEDNYSINEWYKEHISINLKISDNNQHYPNGNYRDSKNAPVDKEKFDRFLCNITKTAAYDYSEGEYCLHKILSGVCVNTFNQQLVYFLDNPENNLHIDWQRNLIKWIRELNPTCQIILTTHSPTIYYQEWIDKVTRIEEIKINQAG